MKTALGDNHGTKPMTMRTDMPAAEATETTRAPIVRFEPIDDRHHKAVEDLLSNGRTTGSIDADAAIIAHARTFSGKGTAEPMEVGGVVTREPRSLTARARLLQDIEAGAKFTGAAEMITRIESDRLTMLDGAKGMGHVAGGGRLDDRIQSKGEYHRLDLDTQIDIADTISSRSNVEPESRARLEAEAVGTKAELAASNVTVLRDRFAYADIGTPIPEKKPGIRDQGASASATTNLTLSQQIASKVMDWGREEKAFKQIVSFYVLDEAVRKGLGHKTQRAELDHDDVKRVQDAVRTWSKPHVRDGVSLEGLDSAVSKAAERYVPTELIASRSKGPDQIEAPVPQRSGFER